MRVLTLYHFAERLEWLQSNRMAERAARRLGHYEWAVRNQQAADRIADELRGSESFRQWIQFLDSKEESAACAVEDQEWKP